VILKVITSNMGKVREYRDAFAPFGIVVEHLKVDYDEVQTSELVEVVGKGMAHLKGMGMTDFIIDDSGLFIDPLNGFPGVFSAYALRTIGNTGVLRLMEDTDERSANFQCCIGCNISGKDVIVLGRCDGVILRKETGTEGFGFDPIFSHDGKRSFAEIPIEEKNNISHRGNAVRLLMKEMERMI